MSKAIAAKKFDVSNFKVTKNITLPILKKDDDVPLFLKITGAVYLGKETTDKSGEKQKPARLCHVINLETGEEMMIVVNEVLFSSLNESYDNDSYVGKSFRIEQRQVVGKKYKNYAIAEIEAF